MPYTGSRVEIGSALGSLNRPSVGAGGRVVEAVVEYRLGGGMGSERRQVQPPSVVPPGGCDGIEGEIILMSWTSLSVLCFGYDDAIGMK